MNTHYLKHLTSANVDLQIPIIRRNSFSWGLTGYRPDHAVMLEILRARHGSKPAFIKGNFTRDETRWLTLYCTDEIYNLQFLMQKTGLRRNGLREFCAYYGVDLKSRNIVGGLK